MATFFKIVFALGFLLLTACAEQPVDKKPAQVKTTAAAKPAQPAKPAAPVKQAQPSTNVRVSENVGHSESVDGAYYVQNRILSSGGAVSGAIMGS